LDIYDAAERARIRAVLLNYISEKVLSVEKLYNAICAAERSTPETIGFSFKTFQRFMAGTRNTGNDAVAICARFAKRLPNQPTVFHALGESLHALYKIPLSSDLAGSYELRSPDTSTVISVSARAEGFALVSEKHTSPLHRLHDGVLVATAPGEYLILLRDRLNLTPRYITTYAGTKHVEPTAFVCDHPSPLYPARLPASYTAVFIPKAD
jgi:hypothetical protein